MRSCISNTSGSSESYSNVTVFTSLNNQLQHFEGKMKHVCICNSNTVYFLFESKKEKTKPWLHRVRG